MNYSSCKSCDVNLKSVGMTLKDEKDEKTVIAKKNRQKMQTYRNPLMNESMTIHE